MVNFRRTLLLLTIVLAIGSVASAQTFNCNATTGAPPIVRGTGVAELVGDALLICTGGVPTALGDPVPRVNFRIFLNVNVTSWLLDTSGANWSEALMIIDDPPEEYQRDCPEFDAFFGINFEVCGLIGVGGEPGINYKNPFAAGNNGQDVYNIYQGVWLSPNRVEWLGVPIDPPGTQHERVIRITNVRANASQLGVSTSLIPSEIRMFLSAQGNTFIQVNNAEQTVAFVQKGMTWEVIDALDLLQCEDQDKLVNPADREESDELGPCDADIFFKFTELFATAWKTRGTRFQNVLDPTPLIYNKESGFTNANLSDNHDIDEAGWASQGTRIILRFNNVPEDAELRMYRRSIHAFTDSGRCALGTSAGTKAGRGEFWSTNRADYWDADDVGEGGADKGSEKWSSVDLDSSGFGTFTYEVEDDDPINNDLLFFALDIVWEADTSNNSPALGAATVNASFAPLTDVFLATTGDPRPRFIDPDPAEPLFTVNTCATNLLWPYVTNQAGFETGMVISNTSLDPFGTPTQEGACTIYYYGFTTGGGPAPAPVVTPPIPAGEHAIWTLSTGGTVQTSGGTIAAVPGFQGYVIASCEFQMAHGYAFISDIGAQNLAQGYLALIMDSQFSQFPRTGSRSEVLGF